MPVTFTTQQIQFLKQTYTKIINASDTFIQMYENMTGAQKQAYKIAAAQSNIDDIQAQINSIDDRYVILKANELTNLNASLSFYQDLLTNFQNEPT